MIQRTTIAVLGGALFLSAHSAMAGSGLRINEIRIDQPGADNDEYLELAGPAGMSLNNVWYIVIGDIDGALPPMQNGGVELAINLTGNSIAADGIFLIAKSTFTLGAADLVAAFALEQNDNLTHMLVTSFTGAVGSDVDADNNGVIDNVLWSSVISSVALVQTPSPDGVSADFYYSTTTVGPDGAFAPSHVWRCGDSPDWNVGSFSLGSASETPGIPNPECGAAPGFVINEARIEQPGDDLDEYFELAGTPGAPLDGLTYIVIGDDTDTPALANSGVVETVIPLSGLAVNASGFFLAAEDRDTLGAVADFFTELNFEAGDNVTHMLVQGFTGASGDDLDLDDDGVFDVTPWTAVVDSIAFLETAVTPPTTTEWAYGDATVGPEGPFVPGHAYRCSPAGTWLIGPFDPAVGVDSPGAANAPCIVCGIPGSGSCFEANGTPGCDDQECCEAVCGVDPACCDTAWDQGCADTAAGLCLSGGEAPDVIINEIRIDQTGADNDEYFELVGAPGTSLDGVTYVVIGDGSGASGIIEAIVPLDGQVIPASGYFVVAEATFTIGAADHTADLNFENGDNVTHLLVFNFTGGNGEDLDVDNDGTLDSAPWETLMDGVAVIINPTPDGVTIEHFYSPNVVGPDGSFAPGQVYRCTPDGTWVVGAFDRAAGTDTPGAANLACGPVDPCGQPGAGDCATAHANPGCDDADCCNAVCDADPACCETAWDQACADSAGELCFAPPEAPEVIINEIRTDQPGTDNDEYFELRGEPGTSLTGLKYLVIGDGSGSSGSGTIEAVVDLTGHSIGASGVFLVGEATMTLGTPDLVANLNFENSDNVTHLLVFNFTGADAQDLDTDNNGTLDVTPWESVVDSVALVVNPAPDGISAEFFYSSTVLGPDGTFVPGHVWRCNDSLAWNIGLFDPVGGNDTPGALNADCGVKPPPCPADLDGDGQVGGADLGILLGAWNASSAGDLDADGDTDGADLGILLGNWGPCPTV